MSKFLRDNATMIALLFVGVLLSIAPYFAQWYESLARLEPFATPRNFNNIALQVTLVGIVAVGMTKVILIGGIDLAVGSLVGLAAICVTWLMQHDLGIWSAVALTLLGGAAIGLWNGFWIARYKIPAFIITLGMMTIARGLALSISSGTSIPVTDQTFPSIGGAYIPKTPSLILLAALWALFVFRAFQDVRQRRRYKLEVSLVEKGVEVAGLSLGVGFAAWVFHGYRGIPMPVGIFAVVALIGVFVLRSTRFGRRLYAMGGNKEAARLSGINIDVTTAVVYVIIAALAALAGVILASRLNGASPNLGTMLELDVIAAVVIGGTSLSGGIGTIGGSVIGAFLIGVLDNGMSLLGVNEFYRFIVKGFIIIIAVLFDVLSKRKKG
jgi:D-xylose transport system permease protein